MKQVYARSGKAAEVRAVVAKLNAQASANDSAGLNVVMAESSAQPAVVTDWSIFQDTENVSSCTRDITSDDTLFTTQLPGRACTRGVRKRTDHARGRLKLGSENQMLRLDSNRECSPPTLGCKLVRGKGLGNRRMTHERHEFAASATAAGPAHQTEQHTTSLIKRPSDTPVTELNDNRQQASVWSEFIGEQPVLEDTLASFEGQTCSFVTML